MRRLRRKHELVLRPVHPNIGIECAYRRKLCALVDEMHDSVLYWVRACYRAHEPVLARDEATPAAQLRMAIAALRKRWLKRFAWAAPKLAEYFATAMAERSDTVLANILRRGGFSVRWQMSRAQRDVMKATIAEQVNLIRSIPSQYLTDVEGLVMRSVQTGRDLGTLTKDLQKRYQLTTRRASLIARDQNNKATASMTRVRQQDLGIKEAIWVHSGAGKEPRPTHVKAGKDRQRYDVTKGWYDPAEKRYIFPGELINCRCVSRAVIPGFS